MHQMQPNKSFLHNSYAATLNKSSGDNASAGNKKKAMSNVKSVSQGKAQPNKSFQHNSFAAKHNDGQNVTFDAKSYAREIFCPSENQRLYNRFEPGDLAKNLTKLWSGSEEVSPREFLPSNSRFRT